MNDAGHETRTTCCYCGVGCGIVVTTDQTGRRSLRGDAQHPGSHGMLCSKGRTLLHTVSDASGRLTVPLMRERRDQPLRPTTWDAAIARMAQAFGDAQRVGGRDAVALYVSGQCLTEEYYLANKLAKGFLGTNNIDTNSRLCMSSAVAGYRRTLGADSVPTGYDDIEHCDTFLLAGSNAAWTHPIIFRRIEARKAAAPQRVKLICIDPRRTDTAAVSDLHLPLIPGTDVALFHGLVRRLRDTQQIDRAFIAAHTQGWDALQAVIEPWTVEATARHCGVEADAICRAADWLGGDRRFLSMWTMGLNQSAVGTDKNVALINLSLVTGKIGKPGCGPFSLTGQPNAMGGREVGGLANLLPAHRDLSNAAERAEVERAWGVAEGTINPAPGLTALEMRDAMADGRLRALWVMTTNPMHSWPDAEATRRAFAQCPFIAVSEMFANETTELADVVLPAAGWLEKSGTMTSSERRVTLLSPAIPAPGDALSDCAILQRFATAMGFGHAFSYADEAAIFAEHVRLTAGRDCDMSGLSHARLQREGSLQWPVPHATHPGTPRLYLDHRFATADGRAKFGAPPVVDRSESVDAAFPLILTTGRVRDHWHTMARTGRVAKLRQHVAQPFAHIHPRDASAIGLGDGDPVRITSRRGSLTVLSVVTTDIRQGTVFVPMHWGRLAAEGAGHANAATSSILDPTSKEPDLKLAAVRIAAVRSAPRRIVVIGGGAAALAFVRAHRRWSPDDQITLIAEEGAELYDRVLLPHLIDGSKAWPDLVRATASDLTREGVTVLAGARALAIDRGARCVHFSHNGASSMCAYDVVVLATGSSANPPSGVVAGMREALTLRRRSDAERIAAQAQPGTTVAIVGAGVLGIELADSLRVRGCRVTVLARGTRLIGRSLTLSASNQLATHLTRRGISVVMNAEISSCERESHSDLLRSVLLADGRRVECEWLVIATGTTPRSDLARAAGIACARGVLVDAWMRSSDPAFYAIGECAEFAGATFGTTASAGQMAEAAAQHLRGNPHAPFAATPIATIVKLQDLPLAAMGEVDPKDGDEVVRWEDPSLGHQVQVVIRNDRVVGALCLGVIGPFPRLRQWIESGLELDEQRSGLLLGGGTSQPKGRLVCSCNQVGADDIVSCISTGVRDLSALCAATRAGMGCGSCKPEVARLLHAQSAQVPA